MVLLNNLIVIGQGAPNQLKDGRQSICVCAYSLDSKHLIRIYPVPIGWLRKWDVFSVDAESSSTDHRENTYKIKNSQTEWKHLSKYIKKQDKQYPAEKREELVNSIGFSVLSYLIDNNKSFGIIKPKIKAFDLVKKNEHTTAQTTLFNNVEDLDEPFTIINQSDYKFKPYLTYECDGDCKCKNKVHKQSISEWGCYEFMRKNPTKEQQLKDNLRLFDDEWNKYILVGNIHKAPQTYIIIDILRFKKKNGK